MITGIHVSSKNGLFVHTWQAAGVALWQIEAHLLPFWAQVSDEDDVPSPWCVFQGTDSLGKQMHSGQWHRGHTQDVVCVEGYQVSIFFCLNDKPNCDPFNTRTDNLKDIHLGGLFIYEQEPENSWLQGALQHDWDARVLCKVLKDQQCPLVLKK